VRELPGALEEVRAQNLLDVVDVGHRGLVQAGIGSLEAHGAWQRGEVDERLRMIMSDVHKACVTVADRFGTPGNYVNGANIAGFLKVADSMIDQGLV